MKDHFEIKSYLMIANLATNQSIEHLNQMPEKYFLVLANDSEEAKLRYANVFENIDGAYGIVIIEYNNDILISYSDYTLLSQFWDNIIEMIIKFLKKGNAMAIFPEDSAFIEINILNPEEINFTKKQKFRDGKVTKQSWVLPKILFLKKLLEAGREFCQVSRKYFYEDYPWMENKITELQNIISREPNS